MDYAGVKRYCLVYNMLEMVIWIITVFGHAVGQTKHAYACAENHSNNGGDCILFDISCMTNQHILIREILYGFGEGPPSCKANMAHCRDETKNGCCTESNSDEMQIFELDRKYEIFKTCSWKQNCKRQTYIGYMVNTRLTSRFSVVEYECQKDSLVVYFCTQERTNGTTVNLIFNRSMGLVNEYAVECTCIVETDTNSTYSISSPDLRLQSESTDEISETLISGLADTVINSSAKLASINSSRHSEVTWLRLLFKLNPEFIWIEAKGDDDATVYVHCFGSNRLQTTYTVSTSATSNSSNSSRMSEISVLDSHEVPITAVVVPVVLLLIGAVISLVLWRKRCGRKGKSEDTSDAIIAKPDTPRKINSDDSDTAIAAKNITKTADNYIVLEAENTYAYIDHGDIDKADSNKGQISTTTRNKYNFIDQINTKPRGKREIGVVVNSAENSYADKDNNRMQNKEEEDSILNNTYAYIDHKDVLNNALTSPKISNATGAPIQTRQSVDHCYVSLNQQTASSKNGSWTDQGRTGAIKANNSKQNYTSSETHDYSVLEPEEVASCDTKVNIPTVEYPENHDYFVLEQQSMTKENSEQYKAKTDMRSTDNVVTPKTHNALVLGTLRTQADVGPVDASVIDVHSKEATGGHYYFVLQPQNNISSFDKNKADIIDTQKEELTGEIHNCFTLEDSSLEKDTNDAVVQTLPDTEYNVLNLKSKPICHDPNYDSLNAAEQSKSGVINTGK